MKNVSNILKNNELNPGSKVILVALSLAKENGASPTIKEIAWMTSLTERTVITLLNNMVKMGLIEKKREKKINQYDLIFE